MITIKRSVSARDMIMFVAGVAFIGWGFHEGGFAMLWFMPVGIFSVLHSILEDESFRRLIASVYGIADRLKLIVRWLNSGGAMMSLGSGLNRRPGGQVPRSLRLTGLKSV
jgi:hypothetical protein